MINIRNQIWCGFIKQISLILVDLIIQKYLKSKRKQMKISYGLIFYFQLLMIVLTVCLAFLYLRPLRKLVFRLANRFNIGQGPVYNIIFWVIFAVIFIILADSVVTYLAIKDTLQLSSKDMLVDNFDAIKSNQHDDYIIIYKKLREYYMAERNFMLTSSTLFVMFVFKNFLAGFKKIYDNQTADEIKVKSA